jgi:hypothetical protein
MGSDLSAATTRQRQLLEQGPSVRRVVSRHSRRTDDEAQRRVHRGGLRTRTPGPTIFENAVSGS